MTIRPCSKCPLKDGCAKRLALLKSVRGLGLTSIKFRCDLLAAHLEPGTWCEANFEYVYDDSNGMTWPGTMRACVVRIRPDGKVVVWCPPTETMWLQSIKKPSSDGSGEEWQGEKIEWVAVWPIRLKPIEGAANEPHCQRCGSPDAAASPNASCVTCSPHDNEGYY